MRMFLALFCLAGLAAAAEVSVQKGTDAVSVSIDGKPFTTFYYGPSLFKPYLHPLRAADGTVVTRYYPMEKKEGESIDHPHHRGLWFAHGDINGMDFWSADAAYEGKKEQPRIRVTQIKQASAKGNTGTIEAIADYLDLKGKPILREDATYVIRAEGDLRIVDCDYRLKALGPVKFGDTKEGMFAIRMAPWLELPDPKGKAPSVPKRTLQMLSSEGVKNDDIWGTRANWVDYSGSVDGKTMGVAIFDNPANFRHPTYWHARGYGLFAANPFGLHDFLRDNTKDGSHSLSAGETMRFRYRVVIHPGDAAQAGIAKLYQEYAGNGKTSD